MENINSKFSKIKFVLAVMPIIIILFFLVEILFIKQFNSQIHSFNTSDEDYSVSMEIGGRDNSTSEWKKRDFDYFGEIVDLNAQTIDGIFINDTNYEIKDWKLRIDFKDECFFNNAWCGLVEIHQDVLTNEKVQTLDLRNYNLEDIELDHFYDGDLLIHLSAGDYIIYYPSERDGEIPADKQSQVVVGFIIYYLDFPDMSDRQIEYSFNRRISDGYAIYTLGIMVVIWFLLLIMYGVYYFTYRSTVKEMEIKKSGIATMSDLYAIIYIIDINKNELMPVVADEESERLRPRNMTASEQLNNMFIFDCEESYQNLALEFCDLNSLDERLQNRKTIVFEYKSKYYGWCRCRFFAMDKEKNLPLEKVIFTIQVINEEKQEMESIAQRVDIAEHENKAKSTFLANMSHEIRTPINTVIGFNTMILREGTDPVIKSYAKKINSAANMLLSLINGILDISKLEAEKMEIVSEEYSFKQMIYDVITMLKGRTEFERLEFICDISPNIPTRLYGDSVRIKQVIINLLTNAAKYTDEGSVKLTIFGKNHGEMEHLLISVKDTGIGIREEDQKKLAERFSRFDNKRNHSIEGTGLGLNLVTNILKLMDSELHVISVYGEGSEFYFEIEQKIISEEEIGAVDFGMEFEDDEYRALFYAPDAKILAVDDNEMNLSVFRNLLKETGLQIDTASSGEKAIEKCSNTKYDLIFMDHMMPGMNGVECFNHIRSQKEALNSDTKVIILTANALKGAKEEYDSIGFDDFLAKPIDADQLEKVIVKHLNPSLITENVKKNTKEELQTEMPTFSGVDTSYGIAHTGDFKNYLTLIKQINSIGATDLQELKKYLEILTDNGEDLEALNAFRIKIHAMKSTANIMGALKLYGLAATIEDQAAKEHVQEILLLTPFFVEGWEKLAIEVKEYFGESKSDKITVDTESVNEYLHLLETSIQAYNIKDSDSLVDKLKSLNWEPEKEELISRLEVAVCNLNAEEVVKLCNELKC